MPRKKLSNEDQPSKANCDLAETLVKELKRDNEWGQPTIYEQQYVTGKLSVIVIWDAWDHVPLEERTATILHAYEVAEDIEYRNRIALANGLTVPEAHAAGMLNYRIIPAVRAGDPVTEEQVRAVMCVQGASTLLDPNHPQLRFRSKEDAEACRRRLIERLPGSDAIWLIDRESQRADSFGLQEMAMTAEP